LASNYAHRTAIKASKAGDYVLGIVPQWLNILPIVHDSLNHCLHIINLAGVVRDYGIQRGLDTVGVITQINHRGLLSAA